MEENNAFVRKFKHFLFVTNLHSINAPGLKINFLPFDFFYYYCLILTLGELFPAIDSLAQVVLLPMDTLTISCLFGGSCYLWNFVRRLFIITIGKKLQNVFDHFSECLIVPMWGEIFEEAMKTRYKSVKNATIVIYILVVGPMAAGAIEKILCTRVLFNSSLLQNVPSVTDVAPFWLVTVQGVLLYYQQSSWVLSEGLFSLLFNFIVAQLEYLSIVLDRIMNQIQTSKDGAVYYIDERGQVNHDPEKIKKIMHQTKIQIALWIDHHTKVIRAHQEMQDCLKPILIGHFGFLTFSICGVLVVISMNILPASIIFLCWVYLAGRMIMTFRLCQTGNLIAEKATQLAQDGLSSNWMGYDLDIQKNLLKIGEITRRELIGESRSMLPVNLPTFMSTVNFQYRFYTFLANVWDKN